MKKILIIASISDDIENIKSDILKEKDYEITTNEKDKYDIVVIFLSNNYLKSGFLQAYVDRIIVNSKTNSNKLIIYELEINLRIPSSLLLFPRFNSSIQLKSLIKDYETIVAINKKKIYIDELRKSYLNKNLALICGAGVSKSADFPDWNTLLLKLINKNFNGDPDLVKLSNANSVSPLILARYIKEFTSVGKDIHINANDRIQYLKKVKDVLYENTKNTSALVNEIVSLARPERDCPGLRAILTFNYDNLIETNLEKEKIKHTSIYLNNQTFKSIDLPIFHLHGFLPNISISKNDDYYIVLSDDDYHNLYSTWFNWSNIIQLNFLRECNCLFIGISLTDPNLRRILDIAKAVNQNHYIILKKNEWSKNEIIDKIRESDADLFNLYVIWVDDYDDIPNVLMNIYMR